MKKVYAIIVAALAAIVLASSMQARQVFLQNNYGAPIEYIELPAARAEGYSTGKPDAIAKLGNGARAEISDFYRENALSIRKIGGSFYDISYILNTMENEGKTRGNSAVAVITIDKSWNPIYWNVYITWERTGKIDINGW